jgi:hypothetical protein
MFHFPAFPPTPYEFRCWRLGITPARFPHSETPGSKLGCQLPRDYRRLQRPSSASGTKASTECPKKLAKQHQHTKTLKSTTHKNADHALKDARVHYAVLKQQTHPKNQTPQPQPTEPKQPDPSGPNSVPQTPNPTTSPFHTPHNRAVLDTSHKTRHPTADAPPTSSKTTAHNRPRTTPDPPDDDPPAP